MKIAVIVLAILLQVCVAFSQQKNENFVTYDIDNFWQAYDSVVQTKDSLLQLNYLNALFIKKGSPGLKAMMEVRNYTPQSYLYAINHYPAFWQSIRSNTGRASGFARSISYEVEKIRDIYPELKPAKIYFTVGALRSGGTTRGDMVLIGSEIALADKSAVTSEFPESYSNLRGHFDSDPIKDLVFNNVHEYVHTQQKSTIGYNLLAQSVLEGVAEFVTVLATKKGSTMPAMLEGNKHADRIRETFASQMFNPFNGYWLYSNSPNEFKLRDLGYYVGYEICKRYYDKAADKKLAIKQMIELDYNDPTALFAFVDESGYFPQSTGELQKSYEASRPIVKSIDRVSATEFIIRFSQPMDPQFRNFDYGPLGESHVLSVKEFKGFSPDGMSATFIAEHQPGKHYQLIIGDRFRSLGPNSISLKPYLLDFKTDNLQGESAGK